MIRRDVTAFANKLTSNGERGSKRRERERADCILTIVTPPTTEFRKVGCVDERAREREAKEREREKERAFVEEAEREKERPASPLLDSSLFNDPHT